jgi:hypothetical protein
LALLGYGSGSGSVVLGAELPRRARACVWQWLGGGSGSGIGCIGSVRSFWDANGVDWSSIGGVMGDYGQVDEVSGSGRVGGVLGAELPRRARAWVAVAGWQLHQVRGNSAVILEFEWCGLVGNWRRYGGFGESW